MKFKMKYLWGFLFWGATYLAGFTHGVAALTHALRGADEVEFADLLFKAHYIPPARASL